MYTPLQMTIRVTRTLLSLLFLLVFIEEAAAQSWQYIAPMKHARGEHQTVTLKDGRIMVIGGRDANEVLASCEIYDPVTKSWSEADSLHVPRRLFRALVLDDGRVFVAGGLTSTGGGAGPTTATCEMFIPDSGHWRKTASMSLPRERYAMCEMPGHRVGLIDGLNAIDASYPKVFDVFNYDNENMSQLAPPPLPEYNGQAIYDPNSNCVFLIGGLQAGFGGWHLLSTQKYSLSTNTWSFADSMIKPEGGYNNTIYSPISHEIFLFEGGIDYAGHNTGLVQALDPITGHWDSVGEMDPCWGNSVNLVGDSILSVGGNNNGAISECWWYDLKKRQAVRCNPLLEPIYAMWSVTSYFQTTEEPCVLHRSIYVTGGTADGQQFTNHCEVLNLASIIAPTSVQVFPSVQRLSSYCDSVTLPVSFKKLGCTSASLVSVRLNSGFQIPISGLNLPLTLDTLSGDVVLKFALLDTAKQQGIDFQFIAGNDTIHQTVSLIVSGLPMHTDAHFLNSIASVVSRCSELDTTISISNVGCDTLVVSALGLSGTDRNLFMLRDNSIRVAPGSTGSIRISAAPSAPGVFAASVTLRLQQYGQSWDSTVALHMSVTNEKPYTVQAIIKDVKDAHPGDTIEIPVYLISSLTSATSSKVDLAYNTNVLTQLDPDLTGTVLEGCPLVDLKERAGGATLTIPTSFSLNSTKPFVKLRFRVLLGDTENALVTIAQLVFGANTLPSSNCLSLSEDTALVTISPRCGDATLAEFMRTGNVGMLNVTQTGDDVRVDLTSSVSSPVEYSLFDMLGRKRGSMITTSSVPWHFSSSSLSSGPYYLQARSSTGVRKRTVFVAH